MGKSISFVFFGKKGEATIPMPALAFNNWVCDAQICGFDVEVALHVPSAIIEIKIDLSRHTAQAHNVIANYRKRHV